MRTRTREKTWLIASSDEQHKEYSSKNSLLLSSSRLWRTLWLWVPDDSAEREWPPSDPGSKQFSFLFFFVSKFSFSLCSPVYLRKPFCSMERIKWPEKISYTNFFSILFFSFFFFLFFSFFLFLSFLVGTYKVSCWRGQRRWRPSWWCQRIRCWRWSGRSGGWQSESGGYRPSPALGSAAPPARSPPAAWTGSTAARTPPGSRLPGSAQTAPMRASWSAARSASLRSPSSAKARSQGTAFPSFSRAAPLLARALTGVRQSDLGGFHETPQWEDQNGSLSLYSTYLNAIDQFSLASPQEKGEEKRNCWRQAPFLRDLTNCQRGGGDLKELGTFLWRRLIFNQH